MKTALALLALALTATAAVADVVNPNDPLVPPVEFDKPYEGELTVIVARDEKHLSDLCSRANLPPHRVTLACTERTAGACRMILPPSALNLAYPFALIVRHEIAHCNGWGGDHPAARPFKTWADVEKAKRTTIPLVVDEAYQLAGEINTAASQFDSFARHVVGKTVAEVAQELTAGDRKPSMMSGFGAYLADKFIRAAKAAGLSPQSRITGEFLSDPVTARVLTEGHIGTKLSEEQWREAHLVAFNASKARQAEEINTAASQFDDFAQQAVGKTVAEFARKLAKPRLLMLDNGTFVMRDSGAFGAGLVNKFIRAAKAVSLSPKSRMTGEVLSDPVTARVLASPIRIGTKLSKEQWREAHLAALNLAETRVPAHGDEDDACAGKAELWATTSGPC